MKSIISLLNLIWFAHSTCVLGGSMNSYLPFFKGIPGDSFALIGNPGTGKSTILNGLVGNSVFPAGVSIGGGLTKDLLEAKVDNVTFYDTPGLNDVAQRKKSGRAIDKLLQMKNEPLKIVFVTTLQSGRVREEDSTTINLVLDAIEDDTNNRFGVIINQVPEMFIQVMEESPQLEDTIQRMLTGDSRTTNHWCYVPHQPALQDKNNGMLMNQDLARFFYKTPVTKKIDVKVHKIDTETYEEKLEQENKRHKDRERRLKMQLAMVTVTAIALSTSGMWKNALVGQNGLVKKLYSVCDKLKCYEKAVPVFEEEIVMEGAKKVINIGAEKIDGFEYVKEVIKITRKIKQIR